MGFSFQFDAIMRDSLPEVVTLGGVSDSGQQVCHERTCGESPVSYSVKAELTTHTRHTHCRRHSDYTHTHCRRHSDHAHTQTHTLQETL